METFEAIRKRCSLKGQISQRDVEPEKISKVLDAACLAPSARNMQPWRFVVVQGKDAVESLVEATFSEPNQMAKKAPVIILVCARPGDDIARDGKEYYLFDTGLAVENMLLAATNLGLVTHTMALIDEVKAKKILHIPEDVRIVVVTPLAYPAAASYDEAAKERLGQRIRKGLKEVVFFNKWEEQEPA
jgi:nitroreductase